MFMLSLVGFIFFMVGVFIAFSISNRWLWLASICLFLGGGLIGVFIEGARSKLLVGIIAGVVANAAIIPSGVYSKYHRNKMSEKLRKIKW